MTKTFPSAIDTWLILLAILVPLLPIAAGLHALLILHAPLGTALAQMSVSLVLFVLLFLTIRFLCLPCEYTLTPGTLEIRSGLLREKIPLTQIQSIAYSRNPLSAPALSLKRLKLTLSNNTIRLISPKDRPAFIATLQTLNPKITTKN